MKSKTKTKIDEENVDKLLQLREDHDLMNELRKTNKRICFCFKKNFDKHLEERIIENAQKSEDFCKRIKIEGIDLEKLIDSHARQ